MKALAKALFSNLTQYFSIPGLSPSHIAHGSIKERIEALSLGLLGTEMKSLICTASTQIPPGAILWGKMKP